MTRQPPPRPAAGRSVHIIDDDEAVLRALSMLLRSCGIDAATHGSAGDFLAALGGLDEQRVACVLTDVRMAEFDGIALLRQLSARDFRRPVLVMTAHGDIATAVRAMKAGAVDFIEKPFGDEILLRAVKLAMAMPDRSATDNIPPGAAASEEDIALATARVAELSRREAEVLRLLVAGGQNKTIAQALSISSRTVEAHRARMMLRLGVQCLAEAVRIAVLAEMGDEPAA